MLASQLCRGHICGWKTAMDYPVNLTEILALKSNKNLHFSILIFCFPQHPVICFLCNTKRIPSFFILKQDVKSCYED